MDLDTALSGKPAEGASATDILRADHLELARLFDEYRSAAGDAHAARVLAQTICMKVELHDAVEREVFYPALREAAPQAIDDAHEDKDAIASAVERLRARADGDQPLDNAVTQLRELVERHVTFEEDRLFSEAESARGVSLKELGCDIVAKKEELTRSTESFEGPAT